MSESEARSPAVAKSDEERAALFDELMRLERNRSVNKLAVATLVVGLLGGLAAPVVGFFAWAQLRERNERGRPLVVIGYGAFVVWVVVTVYLASADRLWWQRSAPPPVSGLELTVGECFNASAMSSEDIVVRLPCTDWHTGEVFAVIPLPNGPYPGIVEQYDDAIARCTATAAETAAVAGRLDGRVQVMSTTPDTWERQKTHRAVCYFRHSYEVNHPL
jgi:hypothetical protein